jgi:hypothetical protein
MGKNAPFVNQSFVCNRPDVDPSIEIAVEEQTSGNGRRVREQVIQQRLESEDSYVADGQVEKDRHEKQRRFHEDKPVLPYDKGNGLTGLKFRAHISLLRENFERVLPSPNKSLDNMEERGAAVFAEPSGALLARSSHPSFLSDVQASSIIPEKCTSHARKITDNHDTL